MLRALLTAFFIALPFAAQADLYSGEVAVADQSEGARSAANVEALKQVLVKVSGDTAAAEKPQVAGALKDPAPLVQAYYYRQEVDRSSPTPRLKLYYVANFEPRAITRLLSSSGLAQWARERPPLMVWVAMADAQNALSAGELEPLLRRAGERGIVLKRGIDDSGAASGSLDERDVAVLKQIAAKAGVPGVLAGRLFSTANGVLGRFAFNDGEKTDSFEVSGNDPAGALVAAADEIANRMAQRYAFDAADSAPSPVRAVVRNLGDAGDYARAQSYLRSLSIVRELRQIGAAGNTLTLDMSVAGGSERLKTIVGLGDVLSAVGESTTGEVVLDLN
jgi:hypothetical protein